MANYQLLEINDNIRAVQCSPTNRRKLIIALIILILALMLGVSLLVVLVETDKCSIDQLGNQWEGFPPSGPLLYLVNFNTDIMQANYVSYISTSGGNGGTAKTFRNDPYGMDVLISADYTNSGYDRGHLVPNADYGDATYYMPNVVPMTPSFNRGTWLQAEQMIRSEYAGKLVVKGCKYSGNFIYSQLGKHLYIPQGCYYIVFDSSDIDMRSGEILDYGYYEMLDGSQKEKRLPSWIRC